MPLEGDEQSFMSTLSRQSLVSGADSSDKLFGAEQNDHLVLVHHRVRLSAC